MDDGARDLQMSQVIQENQEKKNRIDNLSTQLNRSRGREDEIMHTYEDAMDRHDLGGMSEDEAQSAIETAGNLANASMQEFQRFFQQLSPEAREEVMAATQGNTGGGAVEITDE
jgi:cell division septum initiation protein DivIVA